MRFMGRNAECGVTETPQAESRPVARSLGTKITISLFQNGIS